MKTFRRVLGSLFCLVVLVFALAPLGCPPPAPPPDAAPPPSPTIDASVDATADATANATTDASLDAQSDASLDAPPSPSSDASPVDAGQDVFAQACRVLHDVGCPDGKDVTRCANVMRKAQGTLTNFAPACVAKQTTAAGVRTCAPNVCK